MSIPNAALREHIKLLRKASEMDFMEVETKKQEISALHKRMACQGHTIETLQTILRTNESATAHVTLDLDLTGPG